MTPAQQTASNIFEKYRKAYDGEVQGCCLVIADEIQKALGGDVVAGELTWHGGSCRRTHWWVEIDGETLDPMGDWMLELDAPYEHQEAHRNRATFESILPDFERWRVA